MTIFDKLLTDQHRETVHLQAEVPAGTTSFEKAASWTVPRKATVEKLVVWHVPNSEDALQTRPMQKSADGEASIPEYSEDGENFITGEPAGTTIYADEPVDQGDKLVIRAKNTNTSYSYRFRIEATIDYAGGVSRVLGGGA
jgi:hypothetical protein